MAGVGLEPREAGAADARRRRLETQRDDFRREADDLEQLRAAIAGDAADAHLGHDLQQPLADAAAVAAAELQMLVADLGREHAAAPQRVQRLECEVRIHGRGAEADQTGEVMRIARGAGFDQQVHVAAQARAHQVQVDRAGRQQRVHGHGAALGVAVAEQQDFDARTRRRLGLGAEAAQRTFEGFGLGVEVQMQQAVGIGEARQRQQLPQLALREHRRVQQHVVHVVRAVEKDVALAADLRGQRHDRAFAQRIDRRIGDLGEGLAEAVVERPYALADRRHRHIVAHRTDALLLGLGQWPQHRFLFLAGELEQLLEREQGIGREGLGGERGIDQFGVQIAHAALEPLLVRRARAVDRIDRVVVEQGACGQIDRDHLAGAELALGLDALGRDVPDARLRGDDEHAVARQRPARRAQAVAVERARGMAAVAHHHAGRPVPRLGIDRVVLVERGEVGVLVFQRLRGRRHQDAHRLQQVHATEQHPLEHVVERLRVRAVHGHGFVELGDVQLGRRPHAAACLGPAPVALDAVDLAVVRQAPERMRQCPARQRVGREPLVEDHGLGREIVAGEVREQLGQVPRQHHALVAEQAGGEADDVERRVCAQIDLGAAPGQVQRAFERRDVVAVGGDEDLFDAGHRAARQRAQRRIVGRHLAPAGDMDVDVPQPRGEGRAALRCGLGVVRQEHHARRASRSAEVEPGLGGQGVDEGIGRVQQHAAAVAREAVGRDATTMRHARQRLQRAVDDAARGVAADRRNEPEAAGVAFISGVVEAPIRVFPHRRHRNPSRAAWLARGSERQGPCIATTHPRRPSTRA